MKIVESALELVQTPKTALDAHNELHQPHLQDFQSHMPGYKGALAYTAVGIGAGYMAFRSLKNDNPGVPATALLTGAVALPLVTNPLFIGAASAGVTKFAADTYQNIPTDSSWYSKPFKGIYETFVNGVCGVGSLFGATVNGVDSIFGATLGALAGHKMPAIPVEVTKTASVQEVVQVVQSTSTDEIVAEPIGVDSTITEAENLA